MSTNGVYGFRKNRQDKITYNHCDSYPDWLGRQIVAFCKNTSIDDMNAIYDKIILVNQQDCPTSEQIAECIQYYDGTVGYQSTSDWYCLLRNAQGDPNAYKNGLRYMTDNSDFITSTFCEYGYIINLDTNQLEFWVGYQKEPDASNRYGTEGDGWGYPCKQIASYDLHKMAKHREDFYIKRMNKAVANEY